MVKNTSAKGSRFERFIRDYYEERGYFVIRAAGSHGPMDLVAMNFIEIVLINCSVNQPHELQLDLLRDFEKHPPNARKVWWYMDGKAPIVLSVY